MPPKRHKTLPISRYYIIRRGLQGWNWCKKSFFAQEMQLELRISHNPPLKLGCINGHAICTYFVGKYGRLLKHSTLECIFLYVGIQSFATKPELLQGLLRLQITTAPPWYFPSIILSCLSPWLRPPITNPSTVKLPLSIQWTPAAQCCLLGGISSLLAPSPSPCYLLG